MADSHRPLSPHLTIYKPQISSILSILHRLTGIGLCIGLPLLVWFFGELAFGDWENSLFKAFLLSWFGKLALVGWTFCLMYHLCNGIRHLLWDTGWGFHLPQMRLTGWIVVISSLLLTAGIWVGVAIRGGLSL